MTAVKFTFGEDFSDDVENTVRDPKVIAEQEQEQALQKAFAEGEVAGQANALESIEQHCSQLVQNLVIQAEAIESRHNLQADMMHKQAAILAHAITSKLAPALVESTPLDEIELLVKQSIQSNPLESKFIIHVDPRVKGQLEQHLEKVTSQTGFAGKFVILEQEMTNLSDCHIEWTDGGAERNLEALMNTIEGTIKLFVDAPITDDE